MTSQQHGYLQSAQSSKCSYVNLGEVTRRCNVLLERIDLCESQKDQLMITIDMIAIEQLDQLMITIDQLDQLHDNHMIIDDLQSLYKRTHIGTIISPEAAICRLLESSPITLL